MDIPELDEETKREGLAVYRRMRRWYYTTLGTFATAMASPFAAEADLIEEPYALGAAMVFLGSGAILRNRIDDMVSWYRKHWPAAAREVEAQRRYAARHPFGGLGRTLKD